MSSCTYGRSWSLSRYNVVLDVVVVVVVVVVVEVVVEVVLDVGRGILNPTQLENVLTMSDGVKVWLDC